MYSFGVEDMSQKQIKKLMIGTVIPRPILTLSTQNEDGSLNIGPFSYFNMASYNPPLLMVGVQRVNGEVKDTTRNILRNKEAVGHIADENTIEDINQTAASLNYGDSELHRTHLTTVSSDKVATLGLKEMAARYELKLNHHHVIENSSGEKTADLLLLEIVQFHIDESVYQDSYVIADKLKPVARLAGADYAKLGEQFTLNRPE